MPHHLRLKRYAKNCLATLKQAFPYYAVRGHLDNPERINAIYQEKEWVLESPNQELFPPQQQDWALFHGSNPDDGSRLLVFFERLPNKLAIVWILLKLKQGNMLLLKEKCYFDSSEGNVFSAGGLRLECDAPLRRWRVAFNGVLVDQDTLKEVHVKIGARYSGTSHPFEYPKYCPPSKFARRFENEKDLNTSRNMMRRATNLECYEQSGCLYTEISVDGEKEQMVLWGSKIRYVGRAPLFMGVSHHFGYGSCGTVFHVVESTDGKCYGFVFAPSFYMQTLQKGRLSTSPGKNKISFSAGNFDYKIKWIKGAEIPVSSYTSTPLTKWRASTATGRMFFNGEIFDAVIFSLRFCQEYFVPEGEVEKYSHIILDDAMKGDNSLVLSIDEVLCKYPSLTGGKGSSLAVLKSLSKEIETFTVPKALVLTVNAYTEFSKQSNVESTIKELLNASVKATVEQLKAASECCVATLSQAKLPRHLEITLTRKITDYFGTLDTSRRFAVRSSAVGEDSEDMSAAGQMTTYLGVRGLNEIFKTIVMCWASQFSLTALNYKRQYGQELESKMAVVIQEMVDADCAGVMFTCNPLTGDPTTITITANFGLGESVVAAMADPDTYVLKKAAVEGEPDTLTKAMGTKDRVIVQATSGGTEERFLDEEESSRFCLSDTRIRQIARIGVQVQCYLDTPRDMEWAVVADEIYLLQSRPVTSALKESDFEITHDSNTGLTTSRDVLCRANLDEVMPGAMTPITLSAVLAITFDAFVKDFLSNHIPGMLDPSPYLAQQSFNIGKKTFMNFSFNGMGDGRKMVEQSMVTMFGSDVKNHDALVNGIFHPRTIRFSQRMSLLRKMYKLTQSTEEFLRKSALVTENFTVDLPELGNSKDLLISMIRQICKMKKSLFFLCGVTMSSSTFNVITLNVLSASQGEKQATPETMILLSKLLRSDYAVESADIPGNLRDLALLIKSSEIGDSFADMSPDEALEWLQNDEGDCGKHFKDFIGKHGHRCYKEFDLYSNPWCMDPSTLIKALQINVRTVETAKKEEEYLTVDQLEKRPSLIQRKILNYTIPKAKFSVFAREATKSHLVKCIHQLRLAVRKIGAKLHEEGRLPEAELVHFLTLDEIYRLINTRNPNIVVKATRRRRLHLKLDREKFPVLFYGMPTPISMEQADIDPSSTLLKGTPVSEGEVTGVARVIHDFESEAHLIKKGEILVTHATDTGWTPYFPILSGVITQIGGLLSHGAVVAREYGLPAVVGVLGATQIIQSGDLIHLDGNKGTVIKVVPQIDEPEEETDALFTPLTDPTFEVIFRQLSTVSI